MAIVFLRLYNTFFLLISCFLYPIILIQSYMGRENMKKKLNTVLNQKQNALDFQHSSYVSQTICAYSSSINGTQSKYDCHDQSSTCHTDQISRPFLTISLVG